MARQPIRIAGRYFASKKAALTAVRTVLNATPLYTALAGDDLALIQGLLDLHPQGKQKLAGGCIAIRVQKNLINGMPPQRGFHIVRPDTSTIDFSIYVPFQTAGQTARFRLAGAARKAVSRSVAAFKDARFNGAALASCELSGKLLSYEDAAVDHAGDWPFSRILTEWLSERGAPPQVIDRGHYCEFTESDARAFLAFHNARARLRLIDKVKNLSLGARGRDHE